MIENWPALFVYELLFFRVVPEVARVIWPAPYCTIVQLKPTGKLEGTVSVKAADTFILIIFPLSVAANE